VAVVLFLGISGLLARFLSAENVERDDDLALVQAEARGDVAGMLDQLGGCRASPSCVARVEADASNAHVRRSGTVKILQLESKTAFALFGATGKTRLAWTVIGKLPVVQCVDVRRTGNFFTGIDVQLVGLSTPIGNEGICSKRTQTELEEEEDTAVEQGRSPKSHVP
jgi:carbon monoxide dehydrogenase subunit G